jgi:hypothetical protein
MGLAEKTRMMLLKIFVNPPEAAQAWQTAVLLHETYGAVGMRLLPDSILEQARLHWLGVGFSEDPAAAAVSIEYWRRRPRSHD